MGSMTLSLMLTELGFLLRNRNDTDATDLVRKIRWINQAYTFMCHPDVHHLRQMETIDTISLVTDDADYAISTGLSGTPVGIRFVTYVDATTYTAGATKRKVHPL